MYILANRDMELTCDEAVIRRLGQKARAGYAEVLIAMVEIKLSIAPFGNHFSRTAIEERIAAIIKMKKTSLLVVAFAIILVPLTTVTLATAPRSTQILSRDSTIESMIKLAENQAVIDFANGECRSQEFQTMITDFIDAYFSMDREAVKKKAESSMKRTLVDLAPGKTEHYWLELDGSGSKAEIIASTLSSIDIFTSSGEKLCSYQSEMWVDCVTEIELPIIHSYMWAYIAASNANQE